VAKVHVHELGSSRTLCGRERQRRVAGVLTSGVESVSVSGFFTQSSAERTCVRCRRRIQIERESRRGRWTPLKI
jgi:hypothetical protein